MACALAVSVLETMVCEKHVGPLWGVVMAGKFVSKGDGKGHFRVGLEVSWPVLQCENVFCIRLDEMRGWEVPQGQGRRWRWARVNDTLR